MDDAFQSIVGALEYPMIIVTTAAGERRAGCLVGFSTQASIEPPRFLVCISRSNHTLAVAADATTMVVHFPSRAETELAELFGSQTGDEVDKFARCAWHEGPGGVPVLDAVPNWVAGRIVDRLDLGDHVGHLLEPIAGERGDEPPDLDFQQVRDIEAGHPA